MQTDGSTKSGSVYYLIAIPVFAVLCILCLLWLQRLPEIQARAIDCRSEKGNVIVTVRCANRTGEAVLLDFDVELTQGIRDSADQQTIWVPKVQHISGIMIAAKSEKDEIVRIPSGMQYHITEVKIVNLVSSKKPNQAPPPP